MITTNTRPFTFTESITLNIRPRVPIGALVELVNMAHEEFGIGYWVESKQAIKRGTMAGSDYNNCYSFEILPDGEETWYTVNVETVKKGIELIMNGAIQIDPTIKEAISIDVASEDPLRAGKIDSTAIDCIIQAGLFGELVYG